MAFAIERVSLPLKFPKAPQDLYFQGDPCLLDRLPVRGLAVVGTRRPQTRAESLVRKVLRDLRRADLVILSGLALGIDACAHEAALEAGLPTVAVLGCGLDYEYPPENAELRQRILESGGLVVSEYEPGTKPEPWHFLQRNRIIAGLSRASWIVQAPFRSGALNTAKWSRDYNRDVYATPSFPGDAAFLGTENLFNMDLQPARLLTSAASLRQTWSELAELSVTKKPQPHLHVISDPILEQIQYCTAQVGGVTVSDLLDWGVACGFAPLDIFERLQKAQQCGLVSERQGIVAAL